MRKVNLGTMNFLFLVSGAASLIYQVLWVRQFGNLFGNTIQSASLISGIFLGGLGIGSYLAGLISDRSTKIFDLKFFLTNEELKSIKEKSPYLRNFFISK